MAEGGAGEGALAGMAGSDEETAETSSEVALEGLDSSASAMAIRLAAGNAELASRAGQYFEKQARLISIQTEHLHEQRGVQISFLRLKQVSERLRIGIQISIICMATLVGAYLALMLHDAAVSRSVVVEPFETPPDLVRRGMTGQVLAGAVLDQLIRLQAATQSSAAKRDLANSWTGDIKLEVPETGISFGELDRLLKSRLGHDIHIAGDLVQGEGGALELTVRGDRVLPRTFAGAAADLHSLIGQAADYVYGQTQPALFAVYLLRSGRNTEAIAFAKQAVISAPREERAYILNAWANALDNLGGQAKESLALENAALALKPDYWTAYGNAILDASNMGDQEGAWHIGRAMLAAADGRTDPDLQAATQDWYYLTSNMLAQRDAVLADAEEHAGIGSSTLAVNPTLASLDTELHDTEDARRRLRNFDPDDPYAVAMAHFVRGRLAEESGDVQTAWREMEAWGTANANPAISQGDQSFHCSIAQAAEAAGQHDRADAEIAAGGHLVDCARFQADFLDGRGDWSAAQAAYAAAVGVAPDLPGAYFSWGEALARHNDWRGAMAKFAASHERGPGWADPLKAWGDALAHAGRWGDAAGRYAEALRDAPEWAALRQARDAAAAHAAVAH